MVRIYTNDYIGQLYISEANNLSATKRTESFRKLRGVMSSDKSYKEMLEDALKEKYLL